MPLIGLCSMPGDRMSGVNPYCVTALVSCYNSSSLLTGCLDDLIGQSLYEKNQLEIIVIDSGSLENEGAIVAEYQKHYSHIRYLRTERETVYAAWNRGIEIARGKYITNANTDDTHRKDALEFLAAALNKYSDADLAYGQCAFTNLPNDTFPSTNAYLNCLLPPFNAALGMFYCLLGPHPLWRKSVFTKIGVFDSSFTGAGDYDFQMRFIHAGLKAVLVPEILSLFYQNPNGLSLSSNRTLVESKTVESKYRSLIPVSRLYSVNHEEIQSIADAWVAQGNLALTWECAWAKKPPRDYHYAFHCYNKALEVLPGHYPAVRNLVTSLAAEGKWQVCEHLSRKHPQFDDLSKAIAQREILPLVITNAVQKTSSYIVTMEIFAHPAMEQTQNRLSLLDDRNDAGHAFNHVQHAITAINARDMETAFHELSIGSSFVQNEAELQLAFGILMMGIGKIDAAGELFQRTYSIAPETEGLLTCLKFVAGGNRNKPVPRYLVDSAQHIFSNLEFRAVELPSDIAHLLLAGAIAASKSNWPETLEHYRNALEKTGSLNYFSRPLHDKVSYLQSIITSTAPDVLPPVAVKSSLQYKKRERLSRLCRQEDFETIEYRSLCRELDIPYNHYERKNWEYFFVAQALKEENLLSAGKMGLGFGVGKEKMISYLAKHGCLILATDLEPDSAAANAWIDSNQHSDSVRDLFLPGICDYETFASRVQFAYVDMNRIPEELQREEFDFTWSCCAFEHVGSIELGKQFIMNQMKCLKPGGIALHTTEFNLSSDVLTVDSGQTVIFRKCDIEDLAESLRKEGHEIIMNYDVGTGELDRYVDIPPFLSAPDKRHLRFMLWQYITTSIGLLIRKKR